jgi:hypothetical protein
VAPDRLGQTASHCKNDASLNSSSAWWSYERPPRCQQEVCPEASSSDWKLGSILHPLDVQPCRFPRPVTETALLFYFHVNGPTSSLSTWHTVLSAVQKCFPMPIRFSVHPVWSIIAFKCVSGDLSHRFHISNCDFGFDFCRVLRHRQMGHLLFRNLILTFL